MIFVKNTINLLSFYKGPMGLKERFYYWALTIGKYIIIVTELVVVACFFVRIAIDTQLQLVRSSIGDSISHIKSIYPDVLTAQQYQQQVKDQKQIFDLQPKRYDIVKHTFDVVDKTSNRIIITDINFLDNTVSIVASIKGAGSPENGIVQSLANNFKGDSRYTDVILNNVVNNTTTINFNMNMNIVK